jgi:hypothetical protein
MRLASIAFSSGKTWREALDALRRYIEHLITSPQIDALTRADVDLALDRIEHIEKTAGAALKGYLGYLNA